MYRSDGATKIVLKVSVKFIRFLQLWLCLLKFKPERHAKPVCLFLWDSYSTMQLKRKIWLNSALSQKPKFQQAAGARPGMQQVDLLRLLRRKKIAGQPFAKEMLSPETRTAPRSLLNSSAPVFQLVPWV